MLSRTPTVSPSCGFTLFTTVPLASMNETATSSLGGFTTIDLVVMPFLPFVSVTASEAVNVPGLT